MRFVINALTIVVAFFLIACTKEIGFTQDVGETFSLHNACFGEQTGHPFSMNNVLMAFSHLPAETRSGYSLYPSRVTVSDLYSAFDFWFDL